MTSKSTWGSDKTQFFYELTPHKVLDAVEQKLDYPLTGRILTLNSMENRVYQIELDREDLPPTSYERYVIAKFYRPGRWSKEQILEEHMFLKNLKNMDIPAVAPLEDENGCSLHLLESEDIYFCIFPKVSGRNPYELDKEQLEQTGRLLARMHQVGESSQAEHRMKLNVDNYGRSNLSFLLENKHIPHHLEDSYKTVVERVCSNFAPWFDGVKSSLIHGDAHFGNLLWNHEQAFWVDFDDCIVAPAIQDFWLLVNGRDEEAKERLYTMIKGYETIKEFPWESIRLIEVLRFLRMVHFHGWIARRYGDPAFKAAFPEFGTEKYWNQEIKDLYEQEQAIAAFSWF